MLCLAEAFIPELYITALVIFPPVDSTNPAASSSAAGLAQYMDWQNESFCI
jgi:hypothetical protein